MKEIWKDIKNYEGLYQVSNLGNVKSLRTGKKIYYSTAGGYYRVNLFKDKRRKGFSIHRLVAEMFIPNYNNKPCVNHKDCNRKNNKVDNLEWCTYKENNNYGKHILRMKVSGLEYLIKKDYSDQKELAELIKRVKDIVNKD